MADLLLYEVADRVATLTLNRPERRNALSAELMEALQDGLRRADRDPDVGAIVLTGAGKAFCAGGDLSPKQGEGLLARHDSLLVFGEVLEGMHKLGKPVVGAANGHALGGGFGLLMACDFVVARRDARYGTPEIRRGLFPMMILSVLIRVFGRRRTLELLLTGREIDGDRLFAIGGGNEVVEADEVVPRARALAAELGGLSPAIMRLGRRAIFAAEDMTLSQQLEYLRSQFTINSLAEDAAEGITAFFEKREPQWKGK